MRDAGFIMVLHQKNENKVLSALRECRRSTYVKERGLC